MLIDVGREPRRYGDCREALLTQECPYTTARAAVDGGLRRRAELGGRQVARRIGDRVQLHFLHALQHELLHGETPQHAVRRIQLHRLFGVFADFLAIREGRIVVEISLVDEVGAIVIGFQLHPDWEILEHVCEDNLAFESFEK